MQQWRPYAPGPIRLVAKTAVSYQPRADEWDIWIQILRTRLGLSRRELAHILGISLQLLVRMERGEEVSSPEVLDRLEKRCRELLAPLTPLDA